MRRLLLTALLLIATPLSADIRGTVSIDLRNARLNATLDDDYTAVAEESSVKLLLHPALEVHKVTCPICGAFKVERNGDDPATLQIDLTRPLAKGERVVLHIEYGGSIAASYQRSEEFLELGLDDFWYPVNPRIGEIDFRYRLRVHVDEGGFQLVSNGVVKKTADGWLVTSRVPDIDIDLVLGHHLDTVREARNGYDLAIVTQNLAPAVPKKLLGDMRRVLDFYDSTFGASSPERAVTGVFRPHVSRDGQGGYFRKGYFVLPKLVDPGATLPNIAHELAHHWWIHASQQNAWLNESFAEYSAMMAMRKLRGVEAFRKIVAEKASRVSAAPLPPIYGFDRTKNRRITPLMMYAKGPLVLNALEREIGEAKFIHLLRRMVTGNVVDPDHLVVLIGEVASPRVAADFLQLLKE
ncbi:MAG TPA: M1 family aminopeptidase [Thermoanaerobaculia bacterium]|nr:M1 family aminopeptidase [Thermoanaerobaculia bacterium]